MRRRVEFPVEAGVPPATWYVAAEADADGAELLCAYERPQVCIAALLVGANDALSPEELALLNDDRGRISAEEFLRRFPDVLKDDLESIAREEAIVQEESWDDSDDDFAEFGSGDEEVVITDDEGE